MTLLTVLVQTACQHRSANPEDNTDYYNHMIAMFDISGVLLLPTQHCYKSSAVQAKATL